jgi:hypothetical protein
MSCLGDLEQGRGISGKRIWRVMFAGGLACFHGKTFWQVYLAGLFGGSSWLIYFVGFQSKKEAYVVEQ